MTVFLRITYKLMEYGKTTIFIVLQENVGIHKDYASSAIWCTNSVMSGQCFVHRYAIAGSAILAGLSGRNTKDFWESYHPKEG